MEKAKENDLKQTKLNSKLKWIVLNDGSFMTSPKYKEERNKRHGE